MSCAISAMSRRSLIRLGLFGGFLTSNTYTTRFQDSDTTPRRTSSISASYIVLSTASGASRSSSEENPPGPTAFPRRALRTHIKKTSHVSSRNKAHSPPSAPDKTSCFGTNNCSHASNAERTAGLLNFSTVKPPISPTNRKKSGSDAVTHSPSAVSPL